MEIIYYKFNDWNDDVHAAEAWNFEMAVNETRFRLSVPYYIGIEILKNYDPTTELSDASSSGDDGDSTESAVVFANPKKPKARKKAVQLPDVQHILDKLAPDTIPESNPIRSDATLSSSMDSGNNVEETK
jgi:hypothetical protein